MLDIDQKLIGQCSLGPLSAPSETPFEWRIAGGPIVTRFLKMFPGLNFAVSLPIQNGYGQQIIHLVCC